MFKDEQTIKFTFDGTSQGQAPVEETPNYGNTVNDSINDYSKQNSQDNYTALKQHDSQREYPTQPLENSIDLGERNDALNTMPDGETTEVKPQKNTLLLHGSSAVTAEGEAYEQR